MMIKIERNNVIIIKGINKIISVSKIKNDSNKKKLCYYRSYLWERERIEFVFKG